MKKKGRPATVGLQEQRRQELAQEIARYARENAGTPADLDESLGAAGISSLRKARRKLAPFDPASSGG